VTQIPIPKPRKKRKRRNPRTRRKKLCLLKTSVSNPTRKTRFANKQIPERFGAQRRKEERGEL
jgi:hypothetical protein